MKMLRFVSILAIAALCSPAVLAETKARANAAELISEAQLAVAAVVGTARKEAALNPDDATSKPFWDGLQDLSANLEKANAALEKKDNGFFPALASSISGFAQADVALKMSGTPNDATNASMQRLGNVLSVLHENFSKEAARLKQGGELTAQEKQQLEKLIAHQDELLKKLKEVEENVGKNNKAIQEGLEQIKQNSEKIRSSRRTVGSFVGGFFAAHFLYNWVWGWHWWWGPWGAWGPAYIDIGIVVWDDWTSAYVYDWAYADAYVDIADLEFDAIEAEAALYEDSLDYLEAGDFSLNDGELAELSSDLDVNWNDASPEVAEEILSGAEQNFDNPAIYEREAEIQTFEDYGMDDFGGGMGGGADFGGDMGGAADFGGGMDFGFDF